VPISGGLGRDGGRSGSVFSWREKGGGVMWVQTQSQGRGGGGSNYTSDMKHMHASATPHRCTSRALSSTLWVTPWTAAHTGAAGSTTWTTGVRVLEMNFTCRRRRVAKSGDGRRRRVCTWRLWVSATKLGGCGCLPPSFPPSISHLLTPCVSACVKCTPQACVPGFCDRPRLPKPLPVPLPGVSKLQTPPARAAAHKRRELPAVRCTHTERR
jgi:hypothetical protein